MIPHPQVTSGKACKCCGETDDSHDPVAKDKGVEYDVTNGLSVRKSSGDLMASLLRPLATGDPIDPKSRKRDM